MIKSVKINLKKRFLFWWLIVIVMLIASLIYSYIEYSAYEEGQKQAVEFMKAANVVAGLDTYEEYSENEYEEMVFRMYLDCNPYPWRYVAEDGTVIDNSKVIENARDMDRMLGEIMSDCGYDCYYGSKYFEYVGFIEYTVNEVYVLYILWLCIVLALLIMNVWYKVDSKKIMEIEDGVVTCKNQNKIVKKFLVKDIKCIENTGIKGIKVLGDGIVYKINLVQNKDEIRNIVESVDFIEQNVKKDDSLDSLIEYKNMLDNGIITVEEFEEKKKQVLALF